MTQPGPQNQPPHNGDYLRALLSTARRKPGLWVVPLLSAILVALLMAYLGPKTWDATQAILVREELIGRIVGPGRFESLDSMKTAQETIQEASRRPVVLRRVLQQVGPASGRPNDSWPSREDVEVLRTAISFSAPGGAELGKTEVLNMRIKSSSAERAETLVKVLFEETRKELRAIRQRKANSMLEESGQAVQIAIERQQETATRMREIERSVGGDLVDLRGMTQEYGGGGETKRILAQIETESRSALSQQKQAEQLIGYLNEVAREPDQLIATPRELLESQPALSQLKNRLIEAQVSRSKLTGLYSEKHPRVQASDNSVKDIRNQIHVELSSSLVGLQAQQQLATERVELLQSKTVEIKNRNEQIASMRVDYAQLVNEMELRNNELTDAHKEFAQVESMHRAASSVDFMTTFDEAQSGLRPLGPGNKTILMAAAIAGSLIGLGLVMMVTPTPTLFPPRNDGQTPVASNSPTPKPSDPFVGSSVSTVPGSTAPGFVIPDIGSPTQMPTTQMPTTQMPNQPLG